MEKFDKMAYFKSLVEEGRKAQEKKNRIEEEEEARANKIEIEVSLNLKSEKSRYSEEY